MARSRALVAHGAVLVFGTSRKSFIRAVHVAPPDQRLGGTIAASLWAARAGVQILRVHDVAAHRQALLVEAALSEASAGAPSARARAAR